MSTTTPERWPQAMRDAALAGRYRLERELGRGGMAVVHLAEDLRHRRRVAVKILRPELSSGAERFLREIEVAARLAHPNIVPLFDSGSSEGRLFYVMPYIDGESLRARLARERQLPVHEAASIAREVADALAYAHAHGVIHRDVKPENILLHEGHALVADFGVARAVSEVADDRLTGTGLAVGTPAYMSPEQAAGERDVDARSDVYALGGVLYEMLAGEPPYTGPTPQAILARKMTEPLPRLHVVRDVAPALEAVVMRALARAPADRFATAAELGEALRRAVAGVPTPDDLSALAAPRARRQWVALVAGGGAVAAALTGALLLRPRGVPADAGLTPLTTMTESATSPALSPDGRLLAYIAGESTFYGPGQIWVKPLPVGQPVQLTRDALNKMGPAFTPDGSRVTYTTFVAGTGWDTWEVSVNGGEPHRLLTNAGGLTWIAGGQRVLFSELTGRGAQMQVVAATASRAEPRVVYRPPVTGMAHRSRLSPDGRHVLVVEMDYYSWLPCRVVAFDGADSSGGRPVGPRPAQCTDAAWSPDGRWMYFTANAGDGFHVWRQRFPDGTPEQVTPAGATEEEGIAVARDGRSLATSVGIRQSSVWVHDALGDRQVTSEGYGMLPTFSPDGTRLYFLLREGGRGSYVSGGLWVAGLAAGRGPRRLLPDFLMQDFAISPDGERVVFVAAEDRTRSPLWIAPLDGRAAPRRLVPDDVLAARFGRAGEVIYTAREGGVGRVQLERIGEDGSGRRRIAPVVDVLHAISPDGRWAVTRDREGTGALVAHAVDGGAARLLCAGCVAPGSFEHRPWPPEVSWSADGRYLYLDLFGATYAVPLRPGEALPPIPAAGLRSERELAALPGARRLPQPNVFPGPDPSRWAYTKVTIQRNIYRVPLP